MANISSADYVALTTDMWSSSNTMTPYMSITAHYIDKDWVLQSNCLGTIYVPESHTADYLADSILECIKEWRINERNISCVTTDNGANIVAAVWQLNWPWLNCFGHNLNVAINNSLGYRRIRPVQTEHLVYAGPLMGLSQNIGTEDVNS